MSIKSGRSQACAACKYQRRKCTPECPLRPFFPADQPKMFQNAHRLFGVCNIMKIIKNLNYEQRKEAMKSIIYESNLRERFPVHGSWGYICDLNHQIQQLTEQLYRVRAETAILKQQEIDQSRVVDQMELVAVSDGVDPVCHYYPSDHHQYLDGGSISLRSNQILMNGSNDEAYLENVGDTERLNGKVSHPYSMGFHQQETEIFVDQREEEMPFELTADDYCESKETCESSAESSFKGARQSMKKVFQNELMSAAASLRLTSVN